MSTNLSIPDRAALLLEKANTVRARLDRIKGKNDQFNWTRWAMLIDEASAIARDGLMQSWGLLDRVDSLLSEQEK